MRSAQGFKILLAVAAPSISSDLQTQPATHQQQPQEAWDIERAPAFRIHGASHSGAFLILMSVRLLVPCISIR